MSLPLLGAGNAGTPAAALWTPAELSPAIWLEGDDNTGSDGDGIATWVNRGSLADFTQATGGSQPGLEVAELNGLNVVRFITTPRFMTGPDISGVGSSATLFYIVKANADPNAGAGGPGHFGTGGTNNHYNFTDGIIYNGDLSTVRKTVGNHATTIAQWNILGITSAASDWNFYFNGVLFFSTATNTVGLSTAPLLGKSPSANGNNWIAAVLLVGSVLSQSDREKVEGYEAHKWGIASVLDAGHPYKSSPPTLSAELWTPRLIVNERRIIVPARRIIRPAADYKKAA